MTKQLRQEIVTGLSWYGRFQALLLFLIGSMFGIGFIILGYKESKNVHTEKIDAIVTDLDSPCIVINNKFNCKLTVKYNVNNQDYLKTLSVETNNSYIKGDKLTIYYNPSNPEDSLYLDMSPKSSEIILIIIGSILLLISIVVPILTWKSRGFATISGGASLLGTIFRK